MFIAHGIAVLLNSSSFQPLFSLPYFCCCSSFVFYPIMTWFFFIELAPLEPLYSVCSFEWPVPPSFYIIHTAITVIFPRYFHFHYNYFMEYFINDKVLHEVINDNTSTGKHQTLYNACFSCTLPWNFPPAYHISPHQIYPCIPTHWSFTWLWQSNAI